MIPKPDACKGCPFYRTGKYYVPDERVENAPVAIVGQNPGQTEEAEGRPFVGKTGEAMGREFLPRAGLTRGAVTIANAVRCRVNGSNELPELNDTTMRRAIEHCTQAHWRKPEGAKLIVTQGDKALYAMTGEGVNRGGTCRHPKCACKRRGLGDWRGWLLPYNPPPAPSQVMADVHELGSHTSVLCTYHLAYLFRDPSAKAPTVRDWVKVPLILKGTWPERMPSIESYPPAVWPRKSAFDTEFVMETKKLIRYSLAWRDPEPHLYVVEGDDACLVDDLVPAEADELQIIMHNAEADLPYLPWIVGDRPIKVDDSMYSAAVLWSELDKDLDFRSSLYARNNRWKHLVHSNPRVYSGGDAIGTWDVWAADEREFERDPQSRWVYDNVMLPLLPIISKARRHGFRVHDGFRQEAKQVLEARLEDAQHRAQAAVGWPINLGSPAQVANQLYVVERIRQQGFRRPVKR